MLVKDGKAVTAARSLAYARAAFNWAIKREKVLKNPFAGLPIATIVSERERVLTDGELADCRPSDGLPMGAILSNRDSDLAAARGSRRNALVGDRLRFLRLDNAGRPDEERQAT
jgi:hypothetical protein